MAQHDTPQARYLAMQPIFHASLGKTLNAWGRYHRSHSMEDLLAAHQIDLEHLPIRAEWDAVCAAFFGESDSARMNSHIHVGRPSLWEQTDEQKEHDQ